MNNSKSNPEARMKILKAIDAYVARRTKVTRAALDRFSPGVLLRRPQANDWKVVNAARYQATVLTAWVASGLAVGMLAGAVVLYAWILPTQYVALEASVRAEVQAEYEERLSAAEQAHRASVAAHRAREAAILEEAALWQAQAAEAQKTVLTLSQTADRLRAELEVQRVEVVRFKVAVLNPSTDALRVAQAVRKAERVHGIPQKVILAHAMVESSLRANPPVSEDGAVGLMQVVPRFWAKYCGYTAVELQSLGASVDCGAKILKRKFVRHGTWKLAAADYYGALGYSESQIEYWEKILRYSWV